MNFYDVIFAQQKTKTNSKYFGEISDAINVLAGTETTYSPSEMAAEILVAIPDVTVEGNPINITDAAAYPAVNCVTTLEPVQEGSGDPSPENVRPITGHTGVELTRTGKNLLINARTDLTIYGVEFTVDDTGIITVSGTASGNVTAYINANTKIPYGTYVFSKCDLTVSGGSGGIYISSKSSQQGTRLVSALKQGSAQITNSEIGSVWFYIAKGVTINGTVQPMIELGSTATAYEPYTPENHSVTFSQAQSPVYGCEVDWVNGMLRVTNVNIASYNGETLPGVWISDRDVYAEGTTPTTGAQVVYELATPIEIPLTPEVITLLKGENNIWTDSGTSEIEYKVDLQTYLDELTTEQASQLSQSLNLSPLNPRGDAEINDVSEDDT